MTHINQRRDTAAVWVSVNPVLQLGEVGWETDTRKSKLGDGSTPWNGLLYTVAEVDWDPADYNLDDVDNTSDMDKPVSSAVMSALATKVPVNSPAFSGNPTAPTPAAADNDTTLATTAFVQAAITAAIAAAAPSNAITAAINASKLASNPVGTILLSTANVNPGTYIGGTWVAWGSGRVPVGVDAAQAEFNVVEGAGGAKTHALSVAETPVHNHGGATSSSGSHRHSLHVSTGVGASPYYSVMGNGAGDYMDPSAMASDGVHTHPIASVGSGGAHNNLQPYITCFMFKRVT